jgi:hypothetical protein
MVRLILGAYSALEGQLSPGLSFPEISMVAAWLCWLPNLLIAVRITRRNLP